jgi:hypothetical protein
MASEKLLVKALGYAAHGGEGGRIAGVAPGRNYR